MYPVERIPNLVEGLEKALRCERDGTTLKGDKGRVDGIYAFMKSVGLVIGSGGRVRWADGTFTGHRINDSS